MSLQLLVDSSSSMDEEVSDIQKTLGEFIYQLPSQDSVELIDFDVRPKVLQPSTRDRNLVAAAINRLRGGGSTSFFNALYVTLRQLPGFVAGCSRATIYAIGLRATESGEAVLRLRLRRTTCAPRCRSFTFR